MTINLTISEARTILMHCPTLTQCEKDSAIDIPEDRDFFLNEVSNLHNISRKIKRALRSELAKIDKKKRKKRR